MKIELALIAFLASPVASAAMIKWDIENLRTIDNWGSEGGQEYDHLSGSIVWDTNNEEIADLQFQNENLAFSFLRAGHWDANPIGTGDYPDSYLAVSAEVQYQRYMGQEVDWTGGLYFFIEFYEDGASPAGLPFGHFIELDGDRPGLPTVGAQLSLYPSNVVNISEVPEPSTFALLGVGLLGFAAKRPHS